MRTLILALFFASTAVAPSLAQDRGEGWRARGQESSSDDGQRAERRGERRAERERNSNAEVERARPQRAERQQGAARRDAGNATPGLRSWANRQRGSRDGVVAPVVTATPSPEPVAPARVRVVRAPEGGTTTDVRRDRRGGSMADRIVELRRSPNGEQVIVERDRDRDRDTTRRGDRYSGNDRYSGSDRHSRSDRRWTGEWRNDRRYDWRHYRDRNRSVFRIGRYYDPYGYGYRRYSVGYNMYPYYYGSNYWLSDPWMYRLPPAYGPYRWVRYWDDALLVDIYTGEVVDVIHNFFW